MKIAILADIHSNLAAFEAVLEHVGSFDQVWSLGDVVGYGPDPNECIERLWGLPHLCVAGNHDWASISRLDTANFNREAAMAAHWTEETLTPQNRDYLLSLPERVVQDDFTIVHGSPRHPIWEYISHIFVAQPNFAHFDSQFCLVGHTHIPVIFQKTEPGRVQILPFKVGVPLPLGDKRLIINPGGVGQPRDGIPDASYAVLDTEELTITYHRVPYPIGETQSRMMEVGLPPRLIIRLSYGL
ncbi:MAG: metallophosphoesterase family protein [Anaerolineae bacterium]